MTVNDKRRDYVVALYADDKARDASPSTKARAIPATRHDRRSRERPLCPARRRRTGTQSSRLTPTTRLETLRLARRLEPPPQPGMTAGRGSVLCAPSDDGGQGRSRRA